MGYSYKKEMDAIKNIIQKNEESTALNEVDFEEEDAHSQENEHSSVKVSGSKSSELILEEEIEAKILNGEIVFGRSLSIYEGNQYGRQYIIPDIGRIDLLTIDINSNDLIVIELKKDKADDKVVGQILKYIGWVKRNLAVDNQNVYGIICVSQITTRLEHAVSAVPNLELFEYETKFKRIN